MAFEDILNDPEFPAFLDKHDLVMPSNPVLDSDYSIRLGSRSHPNKKSRILKYYDTIRSKDGNEFVRVHWFSKAIPDEYFVLDSKTKPMTEKEKREKEKRERLERERQEKLREENRLKAQQEYFDCGKQCKFHDYLQRKNVFPYYGVKLSEKTYSYEDATKVTKFRMRKGELIIPIVSLEKKFLSYQRIMTSGKKLMATATSQKGGIYPIGMWLGNKTKRVYLCEGYATGATLYEAVNDLVMVCFSIGNIIFVCEEILNNYPDVEIIICSDFDRSSKDQVGLINGLMLAYKHKLKFLFPSSLTSGSDWNDLYIQRGLDAVRNTIGNQMNKLSNFPLMEIIESYIQYLNPQILEKWTDFKDELKLLQQ